MQSIEPRLRSTSHHPHLDLHLRINLTATLQCLTTACSQTLEENEKKLIFSMYTSACTYNQCNYLLSHFNGTCSLCKYISIIGLVFRYWIVWKYMCLPKTRPWNWLLKIYVERRHYLIKDLTISGICQHHLLTLACSLIKPKVTMRWLMVYCHITQPYCGFLCVEVYDTKGISYSISDLDYTGFNLFMEFFVNKKIE